MLDLITRNLRRSGLETQINIVNHETLKKTKENPENYRDFIVRIGGYTHYFTRLRPEMQDEMVQGMEFNHV